MPKAFLSHKSKNKELVGAVFNHVKAASAHYDVVTFEEGKATDAEIEAALADTDLFVLFASDAALEAPWVIREIEIAKRRAAAGSLKAVQVFVIDGLDPKRLPNWLLQYVYSKKANAKLIANQIRSRLLDIALAAHTEVELWVNREDDVRSITTAFAAIGSAPPISLFLSGADGIGRASLARRSLKDSFGFLPNFFVDIVLRNEQSDVDFYRYLLEFTEPTTDAINLALKVGRFEASNAKEKTGLLAEEIGKISKAKQVTFLRGHNAILKDNGALQDWIASLIHELPATAIPQLVTICRRMVPAKERIPYDRRVLFKYVESLSDEDAIRLLGLWFQHFALNASESLLREIASLVGGHPKHIEVAGRYASDVGIARVEADKREFLELIRARADLLIDSVPLDGTQEICLALFSEYGCLSANDLVFAFEEAPDETLMTAIGYLQDVGLIERYGRYFQLPTYLADAVSRRKQNDETVAALTKIRKRFVERLALLQGDESIPISTIESGIVAALRENRDLPQLWLRQSLLPSQLLKVAREFYDTGEYARAEELCGRALERRGGLTREAHIEALRIRGLSTVRRNKPEIFAQCLQELEQYPEAIAKRISNFLQGFKKRWNGRPDAAETFFRRAYEFGGNRNFHVLRELAQVLIYQGRYGEAESFARDALKVGGGNSNPFVLDNLVEILIETRKNDPQRLSEDGEVSGLFDRLEVSARAAKRSFYESRRAHYYLALKNFPLALQWADKAILATPSFVPVYVNRADIYFASHDYRGVEQDIDRIAKLLHAKSGGDKRHWYQLQRLKIRLLTEQRKYPSARLELQSATGMPARLHAALERDLAHQILADPTTDPKLRNWANQRLTALGAGN